MQCCAIVRFIPATDAHVFILDLLCSPFSVFLSIFHSITTDEWQSGIEFLTRAGQASTPMYPEFEYLADMLGASALVETLNNPRVGNATESSFLGPFFTEDAPDRTSRLFLMRGPQLTAPLAPLLTFLTVSHLP